MASKAMVLKALNDLSLTTLNAEGSTLKTIMTSISETLDVAYLKVKSHKEAIQDSVAERLLEGVAGDEDDFLSDLEDETSVDDDERFDAAFAAYPQAMADRIGEVCFYQPTKKKAKEWFPVLIYDLGRLTAGGVRDGWVKKVEDKKPMHIVYYYGTTYSQRNNAYVCRRGAKR